MAKVIEWKQTEVPEDEDQRTIRISEEVTTTKEQVITIAQKENEIANAEQRVIEDQAIVTKLKAELAEIKTALKITDIGETPIE